MSFGRSTAILVGCVCSASGYVNAQPTLNYQSHELKEGRNYVHRLTAQLAVGESSGDASYSYAFDLPASRGATPHLSLDYSSQGGPSEYGLGWELTIPMIERSDRLGVPDGLNDPFRGHELFRYREGHTVRELVDVGGTTGGWETYRERDDQTFARYYLNRGEDRWVIVRPNGERLKLGDGTARRGDDPGSGIEWTDAWLVDRLEDSRGNYATYTYAADPYALAPEWNSRLSSIAYNGNSNSGQTANISVSFTWSTHWANKPPIPTTYRPGFQRKFGQDVLTKVTISAPHHAVTGPATVPTSSPVTRTYTLGYPSASGITHDNVLYLTSLTVEAEPAMTFEYSNPPSAQSIDQPLVLGPEEGEGAEFPNDLGRTDVTTNGDGSITSVTKRVLADFNSDGRVDLIDFSGDIPTVWLSTGTGFSRLYLPALTSTIGALPQPQALRIVEADSVASYTTQDFADLNGDGFPDLIYFVDLNGSRIAYCPGNGEGFDPCTTYGGDIAPSGGNYLRHDQVLAGVNVTDLDLLDVDADGRPDSVTLDTATGQLTIYRNTGSGFEHSAYSPYSGTIPACATIYQVIVPYCLREVATNGGTPNRMLLAELRDMNGDAIPDFLELTNTTPARVAIFFGTGKGIFEFVAQDGNSALDPGSGVQSGTGDYVELNSLADLNGDGLPDIVTGDCRTSSTFNVRYNIGGFFDSGAYTRTLSSSPPGLLFDDPGCTQRMVVSAVNGSTTTFKVVSSLADLNGDGMPDFVSAELDPNPIPPYSTFVVLSRQVQYVAPRKLITARSLNGNHVMTVQYAAQNGDVPYPVHAPIALTRDRTPLYTNEPARYTHVGTTYVYTAPTFRRSELTFGGFAIVVATGDSFATTRTTSYTTGDVDELPGLVTTELVQNNSALGSYVQRINTYLTTQPDSNHYITHRTREDQFVGGRDLITDYTAFDDYGGITNSTEEGDAGTDDDISRETQFVVRDNDDPNDFLLHLPKEETASSVAGGESSTTRYYYDDRAVWGATPTVGDLVKIERERDPGVYVNRQAFFDSDNNVSSEMDELGYQTTYSYDSTYHLYRVTTATSDGTVYRSYHALSGDVAQTCGPQNSGASTLTSLTWDCQQHEEDALSRTTAELVSVWVPNCGGPNPCNDGSYQLSTLSSVAYNDTVYPLTTTVTRRGTSQSIEYRDGFGNPAEVRIQFSPTSYRVYETSYDGFERPIRAELARMESSSAYTHNPPSTEAWVYTHDYVRNTIESVTAPRDPNDNSSPPVSTRVVLPQGVAFTDEDGHETDYYLDGFGRVSSIARIGGMLGTATTLFGYNTAGNITSVQDPNGLQTALGRNLLGWETSVTTPAGEQNQYYYDNRGNISYFTDPRGVTVTYGYDDSGRPTSRISSNESSEIRHVDDRWVYYTPAGVCPSGQSQLCAQNMGHLQTEYSQYGASTQISVTHTYNPEGADASILTSFGLWSGGVTLDYATGARLAGVKYEDGDTVTYQYNLDDSVSEVDSSGIPRVAGVLGAFGYDPAGNVSWVWNDFGLDETRTYDARERPKEIVSYNDIRDMFQPLVDDTATLTKGSLVSKIVRTGYAIDEWPYRNDTFDMTYDELGRLYTVQKNGAGFAQYSYDIGDRITGFNETGGVPGTSTFNFDELTGRTSGSTSRTWTHDASGNVTHDELLNSGTLVRSRDHFWDALGRYTKTLVSDGTSTEYYYTANGDIARVIEPGATLNSDDVLQIGQYGSLNMATGTLTDRIVANGQVLAELRNGEIPAFAHRTFLESVAAVSDDGDILRQEDYTPYGATLAASGSDPYEDHFDGLRTDHLLVAGGRAYDSGAGTWLGRDPKSLGDPRTIINFPQNAALFSFNGNNPLRYRDPSGRDPNCEGAACGNGEGSKSATSRGRVFPASGQPWWKDVWDGYTEVGKGLALFYPRIVYKLGQDLTGARGEGHRAVAVLQVLTLTGWLRTLDYATGVDALPDAAAVAEPVAEPDPATLNPYDLEPTHAMSLSRRQLDRLTKDIRENGMKEPILYVREGGVNYVVDGNNRLGIAKGLRLQSVPVKRVELPWGGYRTVEDLNYTPNPTGY